MVGRDLLIVPIIKSEGVPAAEGVACMARFVALSGVCIDDKT